jgi:HSP20 family protein
MTTVSERGDIVMAQNRTTQPRENQSQQKQNATGTSATPQGGRSTVGVQGGDRERTIQTDRDATTRGGVARRTQSSPSAYGAATSPFSLMRRMAEDMDRIFEDFGFGSPGIGLSPLLTSGPGLGFGGASSPMARAGWVPQIETLRRGDKLVIRADLPGLRKEDVRVEVDDGILTISGQRSEEDEEERDNFYRSERSYGQFYRALPLPEGVNGDTCEATFKDGVLEVTLPVPKEQERKARQIQIR